MGLPTPSTRRLDGVEGDYGFDKACLRSSAGQPHSFLVCYCDASCLSSLFCVFPAGLRVLFLRRGARATLLRCARRCDTCDLSLCNTNKSQPASLAQRTQQ